MDKIYTGLADNLKRFEKDFRDEKERLLFSIAYKLGVDRALKEKKCDHNYEPDLLIGKDVFVCKKCGDVTL